MNQVLTNNPYPPVFFEKLFALTTGEPLSKADKKTPLDLAAQEAEWQARKNENGRMTVRQAARQAAQDFGAGIGPAPIHTPDQAEEIADSVVKGIRSARDAFFEKDARPFLVTLYAGLIARGEAAVADAVARHKAEAESLGLPFLVPPVVRSLERSVELLKRDAEMLLSKSPFVISVSLLPKLGLATK